MHFHFNLLKKKKMRSFISGNGRSADEKYFSEPFRLNKGSNIILITIPIEIVLAELYQTSSSRFIKRENS